LGVTAVRGDAGAVLLAGLPALDDAALADGGASVLDAGALRNTGEILNRSDAGVVQPRLDDLLTANEVHFVEEQLSASDTITDMLIDMLRQVAQRRGIAIGKLHALNDDVLMEPDPASALEQRGGSKEDWAAYRLAADIADVAKQVLRKIAKEWNELPDPAHTAFEDEAKIQHAEPLDWYRRIRAMMYMEGWPDPARHWSQLVEVTLFGVNIERGVHRELVTKLEATTDASPWDVTSKPPEDDKISITSALGFQPRPVANTNKLSNHAWGLAIDVDADLNPYITQKDVMNVIKARTSDHVDLSKDPIDPKTPDDQKLATAYELLKKASDDIVTWLMATISKDATLKAAVEDSDEKLRLANQTKDSATIAAAEQMSKAAHDAWDHDPAVKDLRTLRKHLGEKELENWKRKGFLSLPLEVVTRIKSKGLRWGGEYKEKKDFMHFELSPHGLLERGDGGDQ
jgi:D-alanyl-D-alanine carboxypeptidase